MPASRFATWLGARDCPQSGVTGVTGVTDSKKLSISADLTTNEAVTPDPTQGVTGVTSIASSGAPKGEASKRERVRPRVQPVDLQALLDEVYEGVIFNTRYSRRARRYRRDAR